MCNHAVHYCVLFPCVVQGICEDCPTSYKPALVIVGGIFGAVIVLALLRASLASTRKGGFAQAARAVVVAVRAICPSKIKVYIPLTSSILYLVCYPRFAATPIS